MKNKKYVFDLAAKHTPPVTIHHKLDWLRHNVVDELDGSENIGIELGVAKGIFARRMLDSNMFARFYGVDVYGDTHDTQEYKHALKHIGFQDPRYSLLRMDFENAAEMFENEYFDFIYVDGFAHTGEEGGKTLIDWYQKLKVGGILAGDDYHPAWPLVMWAVNDLASQLEVPIHVTGSEDKSYCLYPTWFIRKPSKQTHTIINNDLYKISMLEKARFNRHKILKISYNKILKLIGLKGR